MIATQNPVEYEGTYPLPEAQLDRFAVRMSIGYPSLAEEALMLAEQTASSPLEELGPVAGRAELVRAVEATRDVFVEESVNRYVVALLRHTRANRYLALGASPRSGIALLRLAKARALVERRDFVAPDDVRAMAEPVLCHRLLLGPEARSGGLTASDIVREALDGTPDPGVRRRSSGAIGLGVAAFIASWAFGSVPLVVVASGSSPPGSRARLGAAHPGRARASSASSCAASAPREATSSSSARAPGRGGPIGGSLACVSRSGAREQEVRCAAHAATIVFPAVARGRHGLAPLDGRRLAIRSASSAST